MKHKHEKLVFEFRIPFRPGIRLGRMDSLACFDVFGFIGWTYSGLFSSSEC